MSETFLQGVCPAAYAPYVPESGILQQVYGTGEEGSCAADPVPEEVPDGRLHRDKLRGQHGTESLPQPADPPAQGVQGAGAEGAVLDGVVLRLQAPSGMQRERRAAQFHAAPRQRGRQGTPQEHGLSGEHFRKARRGQGVHQQGALRETVR